MHPLRWVFNILVALDVLLNACLFGQRHETLSKRAARARDKNQRWGCILCKLLDAIDRNHCEKSLMWDP